MARTGYKGYSTLEEYDTITGLATGVTKANDVSDPDYVAPIEDLSTCPLDASYVKLFNIYTSGDITIAVDSGGVNFKLLIKDGLAWGDSLIDETSLSSTTSPQTLVISGVSTGVKSVYIQVTGDAYASIKSLSVLPYTINSAFLGSLTGLETLSLPSELTLPSQNLSQLDIIACTALKSLTLSNSMLTSLNLTTNTAIEEVYISNNLNLASLTIGSYSNLKILECYNCKFTGVSASATIIDNIIKGFNTAVVGPVIGYLLKYGSNNSSGVQPSSASYSAYTALNGKGVTITGKPPITQTAYLTAVNVNVAPDMVYFNLILSTALSLDIEITGRMQYTHSGGSGIQLFTSTMLAGTTNKPESVSPAYTNISNVNITIFGVTPNPASGVTINY